MWGCDAFVNSTTAGNGWWIGLYTTNGNCLREVDTSNGKARHHCDICDTLGEPLPISELITCIMVGKQPTYVVTCGVCGARECLNAQLTTADEADPNPQRAANARAIRAALRFLGKGIT